MFACPYRPLTEQDVLAGPKILTLPLLNFPA